MQKVEFHVTAISKRESKKAILSFKLDNAREVISEHFGIQPNFKIQLFSEKYGDWIDIKDFEDERLQKGGKLRVEVVKGDEPVERHQEGVKSLETTNKTSISTTRRMSSLPWRSPYKLPEVLPRNVIGILDREGFPSQASRSHLLDAIFTDVSVKYTLYPLSYQYNEIIDAIFQRWPHLTNEDGLEGSSTRVLWRARIRDKFINNRRRKDSQETTVLARKRKSCTEVGQGDVGKGVEGDGAVVATEPELPEGEDEHSIKKHTVWLRQEMKTRKPDMAKVGLLMERTFTTRRQMVTTGKPIADVLEDYPWLANETEMYAEYRRITGQELKPMISAGIEEMSKGVFKLLRTTTTAKPVVKGLLKQTSLTTDEDDKKYYRMCATILGIPGLLKEDVGAFFGKDCEARMTVPSFIIHEGKEDNLSDATFTVISEGRDILKTSNLLEAMATYMAVFYCYNLEYTQSLAKIHMLLDKMVLKVMNRPGKKTLKYKMAEKSVNTLISKFNAEC